MAKFENEIQSKGFIAFTSEGDSMMPLIREHRDILVIKKITEPLKKYDTVLYKRPGGQYVLHRIIKLYGLGRYGIVGDNRLKIETVPEEWIIGILSEIIKDGKHISVESDKKYKAYVRKLPLRRFKFKIQRFVMRFKRKLKRMFGREKE